MECTFFERLFAHKRPEQYVEIRLLGPKGTRAKSLFYQDLAEIPTDWSKEQADGRNVYFGVAPRDEKKGNAVSTILSLWVDVDFKTLPLVHHQLVLKHSPLKPSVAVHSGRGVHLYWVLNEPIEADSEARSALETLIEEFGADKKCSDPPRLLRVPGTKNLKYDDQPPCSIIAQSDQTVKLGDVKKQDPPTAELISWLNALEWTEGERHEAALRVAGSFRVAGYPEKTARIAIDMICALRDDEELADRVSAVKSTYARDGGALVTESLLDSKLRRDNLWVTTRDGEEYPIANFSLMPKQRLVADGKEYLVCDYSGPGLVKEAIIPGEVMISPKDLLKFMAIPGMAFSGTNKDYIAVVQRMAARQVPTIKGVSVIGWSGNTLVTPASSGEIKYLPQHLPLEMEFRIDAPDERQYLEALAKNLPLLHEPGAVWSAMGWLAATAFSPMLRERLDCFPLLLVWGIQGSGKTTMMRTLWEFMGIQGEPRSCKRTIYSSIREAAIINCAPIILDEFRDNESGTRMQQLRTLLRGIYDGHIEQRGTGISSAPVTTYRLTAPHCVIGETPFIDPALLERAVSIELGRRFITEAGAAGRAALAALAALPRGGLLSILARHREEFDLSVRIPQLKAWPPRALKSLGVVFLGLSLLKQLGLKTPSERRIRHYLGKVWERDDYREKSALETYISLVPRLVENELLQYARDVWHDEECGELYIKTEAWLHAMQEYSRRTAALDAFPLTRPSLRAALSDAKGTYVKRPYGFVVKMPVGSTRVSVLHLKYVEERLGIGPNEWSPYSADT